MKRGTADQKPIVLCQLKSRAFDGSQRRNHVTLRTASQLQVRGPHKENPLATRNRNPRLHAPVIARATLRLSPFAPSQRCQSVTARKKFRVFCDPSPRIAPVYGFTKIVVSRPKAISAGANGSDFSVTAVGVAPRASRALVISVSTGRCCVSGVGGAAR